MSYVSRPGWRGEGGVWNLGIRADCGDSCWHLTGLNAMGAVKVNLQTPTAQQMSGNATEKAGLQQQGRAPAVLDGVDGNHGMGVQEGVAES